MQSKLVGAVPCAGAAWAAYSRIREPQSFKSSYANAPTKILIVGGRSSKSIRLAISPSRCGRSVRRSLESGSRRPGRKNLQPLAGHLFDRSSTSGCPAKAAGKRSQGPAQIAIGPQRSV